MEWHFNSLKTTLCSFALLISLMVPFLSHAHGYVLGPRDVLKITVYDHEDLNTIVRVTEGGRISFPLLGEIPVAGLTVQALERKITKMLANGYIVKPHVSVFVEEFRVVVYVTGEVKKPGSYPYEEGMTTLKAITLAGGLTEKAAAGRTKIKRKDDGKEISLKAKMEDAIQPEDVIVVPQSFF